MQIKQHYYLICFCYTKYTGIDEAPYEDATKALAFAPTIIETDNVEREAQMPHSLRAKLSGLRYKKIISDKDYNRLCKALDNENALNKIRAEIEQVAEEESKFDKIWAKGLKYALKIIDKYKGEGEEV